VTNFSARNADEPKAMAWLMAILFSKAAFSSVAMKTRPDVQGLGYDSINPSITLANLAGSLLKPSDESDFQG